MLKEKTPFTKTHLERPSLGQQNTQNLYQEPANGDWDDPHTSSQVLEAHGGNRRTWREEPLQREEA
jgi:hypothetical protein